MVPWSIEPTNHFLSSDSVPLLACAPDDLSPGPWLGLVSHAEEAILLQRGGDSQQHALLRSKEWKWRAARVESAEEALTESCLLISSEMKDVLGFTKL